jgi:uncharacterized protein (TIGR00730 family)
VSSAPEDRGPGDPAGDAALPTRRRYRTGDASLDDAVADLVAAAGVDHDEDLVRELVTSALRFGREGHDRAEVKMVNAALKELRYAFTVFDPYEDVPKVSIFGSARTLPEDPAYQVARAFAAAMAARGWMVITGAGPGIMTAGIEGAGAPRAFGVNIVLPFEAQPSPLLEDDPKLINFRYFFSRKVTFMKESKAFALLPGGFGTMDEAFELLCLLQTGRTHLAPVVLLETADSVGYWRDWLEFLDVHLRRRGLIADDDLCLVRAFDDVEEAVDEVVGFYDTYHSTRLVGRRLVLRLQRRPDDEELAALNDEFGDIVTKGTIERIDATPSEVHDGDVVELPRLAFAFDQASFARLRRLVDRLNERGRALATAHEPGRAPFVDAIEHAGEPATDPDTAPPPHPGGP